MVQGNLLVGSNAWPAAYGAGAGDAFLMGSTWFYNQLILNNGNAGITAWSVNNRTDGNGNVGLVFSPGWSLPKSTVFQSTGDVTFPQKVSIGNVACQTQTACTGPLGINSLTLAVGGKIGAQGGVYVVQVGTPWPDYVFQPTYRLRSLAETERFIAQYQHLPDVPSAREVQANGLELAAMQAVLLRKVEELTLHLIELKKANDALQERVGTLEQQAPTGHE